MTYLLDTHTFLWLLQKPATLPRRVLEIVGNSRETIALSLATPWEMAIKTSLGKLRAADILDDFEHLIATGGYTMLETTPAHAIRSGTLPWHHKDPFDRLIAAQALAMRIPMISRDDIFDLYGVKRIWN